jgi:hypothetical protein
VNKIFINIISSSSMRHFLTPHPCAGWCWIGGGLGELPRVDDFDLYWFAYMVGKVS